MNPDPQHHSNFRTRLTSKPLFTRLPDLTIIGTTTNNSRCRRHRWGKVWSQFTFTFMFKTALCSHLRAESFFCNLGALWIGDQPKMLDPDQYQINTDPKPCRQINTLYNLLPLDALVLAFGVHTSSAGTTGKSSTLRTLRVAAHAPLPKTSIVQV